MFRLYHFANVPSRAVVIGKNNARFVSFHKLKEGFKNLLGTDSNRLPYEHVCQIGDPVLRGRAMKVEPAVIKLADFQKVIIVMSTFLSVSKCFLNLYIYIYIKVD